ncbi:MAG: hypothetical protein ACM3XO_28800, partial [Bacteroidota bacterium]
FHPDAKNRHLATEFPKEGFRILDWAKGQPDLSDAMARVGKRSLASAHRVNARYQLDAGQPRESLRAWFTAFSIHPPTALKRLNLLVSALLQLIGLNRLREYVLHRRQQKYSGGSSKT